MRIPLNIYMAEREVAFGHPWPTRHLHIPVHWDSHPLLGFASQSHAFLEMGHLAPFLKMAEREGFEPSIRGYRIHTFQACSFNHSDISPDIACTANIFHSRLSVFHVLQTEQGNVVYMHEGAQGYTTCRC